jgi:hypothetical protein
VGIQRALGATSQANGTAPSVHVVSEAATVTLLSRTLWVNVPGAEVTFEVPSGQTAVVIGRFSSPVKCSLGAATGCKVRIIVQGAATSPPIHHIKNGERSISVEQSIVNVKPGTRTARVQFQGGGDILSQSQLDLFGWHFAVERWRQT